MGLTVNDFGCDAVKHELLNIVDRKVWKYVCPSQRVTRLQRRVRSTGWRERNGGVDRRRDRDVSFYEVGGSLGG